MGGGITAGDPLGSRPHPGGGHPRKGRPREAPALTLHGKALKVKTEVKFFGLVFLSFPCRIPPKNMPKSHEPPEDALPAKSGEQTGRFY